MSLNLAWFEKWFSVFALIFLTGILRWASLFVPPDPKADATNTYNPFDSASSLLQHGIYSIVFLLLVARPTTTLRTLQGSFWIWILPIMALLSFMWSDFPDWSLRKGITTIQTSYFGLYFASRFDNKQQLQILAWALGIVGVLSILFSAAFPGAAIEAGANAGALRGPFTQKNLLARVAILGTIVFMLNLLEAKNKSFFTWIGLGLYVLLVLLTTSKTALLLLFTILLLLPFYKALRWRTTITIPIVILTILVATSAAALVLTNWESSLAALGRDPDLNGRTGLWLGAIEKILDRPWLGYGYQGFWQDGGGATSLWLKEGYKPPHAHNGYINMPLDLGLVGLFVLILILVLSYGRSIAHLRSNKTAVGLWPLYYITFFIMYNYSENTIIAHNSIFWSLLVTVVLSINSPYRIPIKSSQQINGNFQSRTLLTSIESNNKE